MTADNVPKSVYIPVLWQCCDLIILQGKMETYKQQVDDLNKRLSELQVENESLENRNRLLEKVVQMKDQKPAAATEASPLVSNFKALSSCFYFAHSFSARSLRTS